MAPFDSNRPDATTWNEAVVPNPVRTADEHPARDAAEQAAAYFLQFHEPVYRYVICVNRDPHEAEEITQETFLRLYRALEDGKSLESVRRWVFTVARNLAIDRHRRRKHAQPVLDEAWATLEATVSDGRPTSEEVLVERTRTEQLEAALGCLTDLQRQCLHLRAEGLLYREIAETLGISLCGAADALQRAVKKLRRKISA